MNWKVGNKVFETENEAKQFSKDLMSHGVLGGWCQTEDAVTHRYIFGNDCLTEPI